MAHWKTEESVKHYTRMSPADYARYVNITSKTDADTLMRSKMPDIYLGQVLKEISQAARRIDSGSAPATTRSRANSETSSALSSARHPVAPRTATDTDEAVQSAPQPRGPPLRS